MASFLIIEILIWIRPRFLTFFWYALPKINVPSFIALDPVSFVLIHTDISLFDISKFL